MIERKMFKCPLILFCSKEFEIVVETEVMRTYNRGSVKNNFCEGEKNE